MTVTTIPRVLCSISGEFYVDLSLRQLSSEPSKSTLKGIICFAIAPHHATHGYTTTHTDRTD